MGTRVYKKETKEKMPVIAICYDFDKTLSPTDMQAQGYIQSVGYDVGEFWEKSNGLAENNDMDQNLAYMFLMKEESEGKFVFNKQTLMDYGAKVELFPGVENWFDRIIKYGKEHGIIVEHYIISSGLKEMIEGTIVAQKGAFKKIYASSFFYNEKGVATWPAQVVNYTNKTQFLFRIEKGVLDVNDPDVNEYYNPDEIRIPFRNMIYIGDSDTDIPCMKLVDSHGGYSIGVYNGISNDKTKVYKMMKDNRIKYFAPADYSEGKELDCLVKEIIDRTEANEKLEERYLQYSKEVKAYDEQKPEDEKHKNELIMRLENSRSFAHTHTIISELLSIKHWNRNQVAWLCAIAIKNGQIRYILQDPDVEQFYSGILKDIKNMDEYEQQVIDLLIEDKDV